MAIRFFFLANNIQLRERTKLKQFIPTVFKQYGKALESLNYIFCSDEYLLTINQQHLNHNYYTDIITFDLSGKGLPTFGEIYISIDRVRENALDQSTTLNEELHRVIFHGALHLCGFKDKGPKEIMKMRLAENDLLRKYFKK
jgi:probable rRNA maturation factor